MPSHPPSRELSLRASREIFVQTTRLHCRGRRPRRPVTQENDTLKPNNPSPIYDGSSLYTREPFFVRTTRQHRRGGVCSEPPKLILFVSGNPTPPPVTQENVTFASNERFVNRPYGFVLTIRLHIGSLREGAPVERRVEESAQQ